MLTGGCQCGAIRYAVKAGLVRIDVCHCTECRALGSVFGLGLRVRPTTARLSQGASRVWQNGAKH